MTEELQQTILGNGRSDPSGAARLQRALGRRGPRGDPEETPKE